MSISVLENPVVIRRPYLVNPCKSAFRPFKVIQGLKAHMRLPISPS